MTTVGCGCLGDSDCRQCGGTGILRFKGEPPEPPPEVPPGYCTKCRRAGVCTWDCQPTPEHAATALRLLAAINERDELRAKLARLFEDIESDDGCSVEGGCSDDAPCGLHRLRAKLADALNGVYCPQCGDAGLTAAGAEALTKLTEPLRAKLAEAERFESDERRLRESADEEIAELTRKAEAAEARVKELELSASKHAEFCAGTITHHSMKDW